ncbi:hypothetical protein AB0I69_40615 [Streptomyces sp. NPDC050508]|uniref:hypothetical protein n=1 Tax=Streptomyces sp. NPDC050508 TaxID=3155405 RepID=UPI00344A640A
MYDDTGTQELEKFGLLGRVDLAKDLKSGSITQGAPGTSGTDAGTQVSAYWSATGTGTRASGPAGDITGGGSNPAQLPTMNAEYDRWRNTAKTVEKADTTTCTITRGHDKARRPP